MICKKHRFEEPKLELLKGGKEYRLQESRLHAFYKSLEIFPKEFLHQPMVQTTYQIHFGKKVHSSYNTSHCERGESSNALFPFTHKLLKDTSVHLER